MQTKLTASADPDALKKESSMPDDKQAPLERYFRILETLTAFPDGVALADLSKMLLLPKPSVHRLLASLQKSGLVAMLAGTNAYVLGERTRRLALLSAKPDFLAHLMRSVLQQMVGESGETCYVARLEDAVVRTVAMESPDLPWRGFVLPGKIQHPSATACAKSLLAFQDDALLMRALDGRLDPLTPLTKLKVPEIQAELATVRAQGFATCLGEVDEALGAIAVPVPTGATGVIYALGVVGPLPRIRALLDGQFQTRMSEHASAIGAALTHGASGEVPR